MLNIYTQMKLIIIVCILLLLQTSQAHAQSFSYETDSLIDYRNMHLVQTGAYAVKVIQGGGLLSTNDNSYDSIYFRMQGDSVVATKIYLYKGKYPKLSEEIVYSKDWKRRRYHSYPIKSALDERVTIYDFRGKTLSEYRHNFNTDSGMNDSLRLSEENTYNENGNLITSVYFKNGEINMKQINSYNKNSFLNQSVHYDRGEDPILPDSLDEFETTHYKEKNPKGKELRFARKTIYEIDSSKRSLTSSTYEGKDSLVARSLDTFDDKWHLVSRTNYNANGAVEFTGIYKYDSAGHEIYSSSHYENNILDVVKENEYDSKGRIVYERSSSEGKIGEESKYTYEKGGSDVVKRSILYLGKDKKEYMESSVYDEKGNIIFTSNSFLGMNRTTNYKIYY